MLSFVGFGKKRRSVRRRKSKKHVSHKPPARLLKICKKYRVKATKKVGKHRVYKSIAVLKKACLKKALALKKKYLKAMKRAHKTGRKTTRRRTTVTRRRRRPRKEVMSAMDFGMMPMMRFGNNKEGNVALKKAHEDYLKQKMDIRDFCNNSGYSMPRKAPVPGTSKSIPIDTGFGKKRGPNKAAAQKAFNEFYRKHARGCGRRSGFGSGGNPALWSSMGYEFCPSGMGGVLGATSTGLFPSPCVSLSSSQRAAEAALALPSYASSFGSPIHSMRRKPTKKKKSTKACYR
jgi:hypothetical protein